MSPTLLLYSRICYTIVGGFSHILEFDEKLELQHRPNHLTKWRSVLWICVKKQLFAFVARHTTWNCRLLWLVSCPCPHLKSLDNWEIVFFWSSRFLGFCLEQISDCVLPKWRWGFIWKMYLFILKPSDSVNIINMIILRSKGEETKKDSNYF